VTFVVDFACQVNIEMSPRKNELRLRPKLATADEAVLLTLQTVPAVGETKARSLLRRFHCMSNVSAVFITALWNIQRAAATVKFC